MPAGNIADTSFAVQTTKGTPATPGASTMARVYLAGGGLMAVKETADLEETGGIRLRSGNFVTKVEASGSPEFFVRPDMIGWLLWGAFGTKVTTGSADPWTHTFTLTATQPYMTFWRMLGAALFERFGDCKIASLTFHSEAGQPLRVTAEVVGLAPASQTTAMTTATVEIVAPFMHADGKSLLIFEASPVAAIDTFDLTIAANVTTQQGDDVVPFQAAEGMYDITLAVEQTLIDFALYNRMIYGTASPGANAAPSPNVVELSGASIVNMKFAKRDSAGAVASPERSLNFTADRLAISEVTGIESNTSGEPLRMAVTYKVYQPSGGGSGLTAVLKNGKTAYASS
jgi:hypothetical protein